MNISQYITQNGMTQLEFGRKIGKTQAAVSHYINGQRKIDPILARSIEKTTNGDITAEDLRPDIFIKDGEE